MVPHIKVEDTLHQAFGFDEPVLAVTAVKDDSKGEKLVVMHLPVVKEQLDKKEVTKQLKKGGFPNLWIPKEYIQIDALPILASGKLALKKLEKMANDMINKNK